MIRIRALNEEYNNDEEASEGTTTRKPTREAQEQEAVDLYNSSFELISNCKYDEAVSTLEAILDLPFFEEEDEKKCSPVQLQIKLGCLKSLSSIYYSLDPNPEEAVKVLRLALALDPMNVTLWYRLGLVAIKVGDFELAYSAFAQGFDVSNNHWGCLENLITLSYVLFDNTTCLEYCALGLGRDAGFIRGLVFRDHIFRLQPSVKEETVAKWDVLRIEHPYSKGWEEKYLSEVQNLLRIQTERAEEKLREETRKASEVFLCHHQLNGLTFSELCRILLLLYQDAKSERALLRPVQLTLKDEFTTPISVVTSEPMEIDPGLQDTNDEMSLGPAVPNIPVQIPNGIESGTETTLGGNESVQESGDKSAEDSNLNDLRAEKEQEDEEDNRDRNSKKKKRDIKWWQLEGKRRSQRVRGHLVSASSPPKPLPNKETDFATKLKNIIPVSLLVGDDDLEKESNSKSNLTSPSCSLLSQNYFGSDEESGDVQQFLTEHALSNTMDLVIDLTQLLGTKTDKHWPVELRTNYFQLYSLYRNHVPQPDPFTNDEFILESLPMECRLSLTLLELYREKFPSAQKLKSDESFNVNLFFVSELCRVVDDPILLFRFNWFLVNFHQSSTRAGNSSFTLTKFYLEELEDELPEGLNIFIPTQTDNVISLEEVRKKLLIVQRTENVNRINELYEAKNYAELIEILPFFPTGPDGSEGLNLLNQYYLADSYYHLQRYGESHVECLKILKDAKLPSNNQTLQKTVILLKRAVRVKEYDIPLRLIRQTMKGMTTLLTDQRPYIPSILPISPWCVLHTLLFKLEEQDPGVYIDEDACPPSIRLLRFAHEQLGRGGKCSLNKGKLLSYTLDSLLPLVSNELYSDHEDLKRCIEQAIFCLYGHPTKLSRFRYLSDHSNVNVTLDLVRSRQLYEYYRPEKLPEFDSYDSISEAEASLFLRILTLIPSDEKPEENFEKLKKFFNGEEEEVGGLNVKKDFDPKLHDIFYLLADHYFKIKEWTKSTEFYTWDLAVTPVRFDSWAGIALAKVERITTQLNFCGIFTITEIMSIANVAGKCFQNALELDPSNSKLRIEFGSFLYSMHSFCSRLLKQNTDQLNLDHFDLIEAKKEEFLARSARCFEPVASSNIADQSESPEEEQHEEIWIHHYMLGKVMEKLDPHSPTAFLDQYEMAGKLLHEQGAMYPMKISYYSPQELSIEALEIIYRIHASILNYIEKHEYSEEMEGKLLSYVERARESPFMKAKLKRPESATESKRKKHEKTVAEVKILLDDMVGRVEEILKADEVGVGRPSESSSGRTSSASSTEDSSDTSTGEDSNPPEQPPPPQSFRLSVFQDKLRETELRELRLIEAARIAAEEKEKSSKGPDPEGGSVPPPSTVPDEDSHWKDCNYGKIIAHCVKALQECIARFPTHHRSYFRISYAYSTFSKTHYKVSRDWFLGSASTEKKKIPGLFGDRKPSNFFNGIWRNPIDDIDRPGSFPYHMSKTMQNLLEVLNSLNDHEMLTEVGLQLAKIPDSDKKYLSNAEREQFSQHAMTSAISAAKRLLKSPGNRLQEVGMGIYSSYLKIQKSSFLKENGMGPILIDAYEKYLLSKGMTPEALTVEAALKHYQHVSWTAKPKPSSQPKGTAQVSQETRRKSSIKRPTPGQIPTSSMSILPPLPVLTPRTEPLPISAPHVMPQVSLFNTLLSSSSTLTQANGTQQPQPIRKKPPLKPAPQLLKQGGGDPTTRLPGRELPSLLSIPATTEEYMRQFGLMFMPPTTAPSTSTSIAPSILTFPSASSTFPYIPPVSSSASGKEEFIVPDLNTSPTSVPWLGSLWGSNTLRSAASSTKSTSPGTSTKNVKRPPSGKKQTVLSAEAKEAIAKFQKTRSVWDAGKRNSGDQSFLNVNPDPVNQDGMSELTKVIRAAAAAAAGRNEAYSMFQGQLPKKPPLTSKPQGRRGSDAVGPSVKISRVERNGQGPGSTAKQSTSSSPSVLSGSIILDGETLPVFGWADSAPTASRPPSSGTKAAPASVLARRRNRSGGNKNQTGLVPGGANQLSGPRRRAPSPSILRTPPSSVPHSTISTFNTSPFKAQSTMVSNPGQFIKCPTEILIYSRGASTPPAAHSASKTPPHAGSSSIGFQEIIDLTTKSPIKFPSPPPLLVPSTNTTAKAMALPLPRLQDNGGGGGRGVKRPIPQMIAIGGQPTSDTSPGGHSLPPKKKLAMRKLEVGGINPNTPSPPPPPPRMSSIIVPPKPDKPEVITLD